MNEILVSEISEAVNILKNGGVILYPTDTIWGIGCDATNTSAIQKIYNIKERNDNKSMLVLLDNANKLDQYMDEVPEMAFQIIDIADKPLTIIYPNARNIAQNLISDDKTIDIRITSDEFCNALIKKFGKPIVSTSANISGEPNPKSFDQIAPKIKNKVDHIVKWRLNEKNSNQPSSIIKIGIKGEIKIIR